MESVVGDVPRSYRWYQVWQKIYFHPSIDSFLDILADPSANILRAFLWVAAAAAIAFFFSFRYGFSDTGIEPGWTAALGTLLFAVTAVVVLVVATAAIQAAAGLFGGRGPFERMVYCLGAIAAPYLLVFGSLFAVSTGYTTFLGKDPPELLVVLSVLWTNYQLVLLTIAIGAVHKFSPDRVRFFIILALVLVTAAAIGIAVLALITGYISRLY